MEVILREHVDHLGRRGEVVKVAAGYARNYLLPRKLALLATDGNKKQIEREKGKFDAKENEERRIEEIELLFDAEAPEMPEKIVVNVIAVEAIEIVGEGQQPGQMVELFVPVRRERQDHQRKDADRSEVEGQYAKRSF